MFVLLTGDIQERASARMVNVRKGLGDIGNIDLSNDSETRV